ncbi:5-methyltetrahydropteroyltriglutamate--homocysteine S-methyltransferase [Anaerolineae bacterium CFX9]|nr:5-methyltetrahydropteroyltriglutamate--homocysteine S-methyltransferase [Anaerolineae bacterium CFX9]
MVLAANLGYPRFGAKRELKRALESYWGGKITQTELLAAGREIRLTHWQIQQAAGIDVIPSNDFSFYDQVLDTTWMVGAIPARFSALDSGSLDTYFAMARGLQKDGLDIPALEMTKWFDTNYHYLVPEIAPGQAFRLTSTKIVDEFIEARAAGIHTRPVLLGPVSYLLLSKTADDGIAVEQPEGPPLDALPRLLPVYVEVLQRLAAAGADWVQVDEPCLVLDLDEQAQAAYWVAYEHFAQVGEIHIMLATYFGALADHLKLAVDLPVAGLHLDLVRAAEQLEEALALLPAGKMLSVGVVDGRNIWRTDLDAALAKVERAVGTFGKDRVQIAPSCSLMFSPHDLELETELDAELKSWLAFARQKLDELVLLKRAVSEGLETVAEPFALSRAAVESRRHSPRTHNPQVRARLEALDPAMLQRHSDFATRKAVQAQRLKLPPLPTTTIGSFPQTAEVRAQRTACNQGEITQEQYDDFLKAEIARAIHLQEDIGLDVLVHGEFERTDMVEYFGEQLTGIAFTRHGWVQSYGSRGVRPPILYGDVARPAPMTVNWSTYAQSLTERPVKGMLTGPVTILQWSFVRDDQPHSETCRQIALAIRDEVLDLEAAGMRIIQIDEPALREGLPLRRAAWDAYLNWAVDCFRLASGGVRDETQIHTHMCYAEFNDIIDAIARMDADVISIEASRSKMELLEAFRRYAYPNDIGPGLYDIHSPRIPSQSELEALITRAMQVLPANQLWINPDCGLKTRTWEQVIPALRTMTAAAQQARTSLVTGQSQQVNDVKP